MNMIRYDNTNGSHGGFMDVPLGRAAKYGTLLVEVSKLPQVALDHVFSYGLRQILNDAIADKTDDEDRPLGAEELVAKAQRRLDTLYSGELRVRRAEAEPTDPIEAEMHRMAKSKIVQFAKNCPEAAKVPKGTKDRTLWVLQARNGAEFTMERAIAQYIERTPGLRKSAEMIVRERGKNAVAAEDLGM